MSGGRNGSAALLLLVAAVAAFEGCGGTSAGGRGVRSGAGEFPEYLTQAESTFTPSAYGIETWKEPDAPAGGGGEPDSAGAAEPAAIDTVGGFRVQVLISMDIDEATSLRDSLSAALPGEWVYVVYHPPYYKVRAGNFPDRYLAEPLLEELRRGGHPDAWIVPDRVLRNPQPKTAPQPPDSSSPAEPRR